MRFIIRAGSTNNDAQATVDSVRPYSELSTTPTYAVILERGRAALTYHWGQTGSARGVSVCHMCIHVFRKSVPISEIMRLKGYINELA